MFAKLISLFYKCLYGRKLFILNRGKGVFLLKLKGNLNLICKGDTHRSRIYVTGKNAKIEFDEGTFIYNCIIIVRGDNCSLYIKGGRIMKNTIFELLDSNTKISIGENTGLNNNRILVAGINNYIKIGTNCILAESAEIWASDTHSILDSLSKKRLNPDKPIVIGNNVWIGNRALILKGSNIGNNSIVGAGSILSSNVSPNTLVAGIPAKVLKTNVEWNINRL